MVIHVEDAAVGFDVNARVASTQGFGLFSVREQVARLGGELTIDSAPDQGTRVELRVPISAAK